MKENLIMSEIDFGGAIYTDADAEIEKLTFALSQLFNSLPDKWNNVETSVGEFSVLKNDEFDEQMRKDNEDGFLYYRYLIEVEPNKELGEENAVAFTAKLLEYLWSQGYPATAACGYEDALPNKGKLIPENYNWGEYYIWK
jgi:hypothetical protein